MTEAIDIKLNTREFTRHLTHAARRQVPYATAMALTQTAKDAQDETKRKMTGTMRLKSNWAKSGLRITPARKNDGMWRMFAAVGHRDWYMAQQLGRMTVVRKSKEAEYQYIPRGVKRSKTGRITKAMTPARLLKKRNVFMVKTGSERAAIYQKKGQKLILMYSAVKHQTVSPAMSLQDTVAKTAQKTFPRNWVRSMSKAMRTSRAGR